MRFPTRIGFAVGLMSLIIADHALSKSRAAPRFTDPDLIALEKFGARAKRAMDAFVLRPRLPDAYNLVCSGCAPDDSTASPIRVARASRKIQAEEHVAAGLDVPTTLKPKYVSMQPAKVRRAAALKRRAALRRRHLKRSVQFRQILQVENSWDAELRR
ncbi:MAG: hypothetical protein Q7T93_10890 [Methylobacterium sp.]|nr:hypothetical protein [Methylobacterium sp.]